MTSSTYTLVDRFIFPTGDTERRKYRVGLKLSGTNPNARIVCGGYTYEATASGWNQDTPTIKTSWHVSGFVYALDLGRNGEPRHPPDP
ncbi:MAG: hypothetical protein U1F43_26195 [Myxococcota bacterium]